MTALLKPDKAIFPIYVGYDIREHAAWLVCRRSLRAPLHNWKVGRPDRILMVQPLAHRPLRRELQFTRPWEIAEDGQMIDLTDGRPFSTDFSHLRFITPALAQEAKAHVPEGERGWAMFVDCDFMYRVPVTNILEDLDPTKAIYVVKHDFARIAEGVKMDGMVQQRYHRKLWSSMVLWNLDHPKVREIDWRHEVNHAPGGKMHAFDWFQDEEIGALDERWNWIPGHSPADMVPFAVHWSFGGPWMEGYEQTPFHDEWNRHMHNEVMTMGNPDDVIGDYSELFPIL